MATVRALVRACHPLPAAAVTAFIVSLGWALGWAGARLAELLAVVLVGQLSVGWSNDAHDRDLDRASGRMDKPVAQGVLPAGSLWGLALTALAVSAIGSWGVAGWLGGTFHILALLAAWAYNLRLSRTRWSWAPYAVAFGCVPAFLSYGVSGHAPDWWLVLVAALLGVSGHLANACPDIQADAAAGHGGLAVQLGLRGSLRACWMLLALACALLASASVWEHGGAGYFAAAVILAGGIAGFSWSRVSRRPRTPFHAVLMVTAVDLLALILVVRGGA